MIIKKYMPLLLSAVLAFSISVTGCSSSPSGGDVDTPPAQTDEINTAEDETSEADAVEEEASEEEVAEEEASEESAE